ncbi:ISAs1 family transposase [Frankia sp. Cj3]|uniref:ISAs1 family transposase n=1 Tax=Frankia sp. Cj3 TaxID=2880976 RepID=UPI001EF65A53|nr:ISAs1 family transposase [Frankia sp. Cj3]
MPSSPLAAVLDECAAQIPHRINQPPPVTKGDQTALLEALAQVPDPRRRRGVRHPFATLLAIAVCAMLSGARSFAAIGEWAADLPADARAGLGLTGRIPGPVTIWRVLVRVDRAALEAAIGAWIRARLDAVDTAAQRPTPRRRVRRVLAVDGKTMRATRHGAHPVHLLGVLDHARGVVLAQVDVDEKTNEIPVFSTVLDQIPDLTDILITVDAMHAQTAHADYLHTRGAHLLVTVKRGPAHRPHPVDDAAVEGRPGRAHHHRPWPRPDRDTHPEGRHCPGRARVPPRRPGHPDHPHLPPDQHEQEEDREYAPPATGDRLRDLHPARPRRPAR